MSGEETPARAPRRRVPAASPVVETISSIGPSCVCATRLIDALNVSPTTKEPVMIAVPSSEPSTTSSVSRGRRVALRNASRRNTGRRASEVQEGQRKDRDDDHGCTALARSSLTMSPSRIRITRFALWPTPSSCVTTISVRPSACSSRRSVSTWSAVSESSAPVGSSAHTTRGRPASARATVTRCCSPPESSAGRCLSR